MERFEIFGYPGIFSLGRIKQSELPQGLYAYDLRDECDGVINELKDSVTVNHFGTCILKVKLEGSKEGIPVTQDDYNFVGEDITIEQYLNE